MDNKVSIYTLGEGENNFHFDLQSERTEIVRQVFLNSQ